MKIEVTVRELVCAASPVKVTVDSYLKFWFDGGFFHIKTDAKTTVSWPSTALAMVEQREVED